MYEHIPVLLNESIDALNIRPDGIYVDGTLGGGGHSAEIAKRLCGGRLISIDRDRRAIERAGERLRPYADRITTIHADFRDLTSVLDGLGIGECDGMLFDLGLSSPQLDEGERGFSHNTDAPLDMRMDETQGLTAYDIVNGRTEDELKHLLWDYGEERYAPKIAASIVRTRSVKPIRTTLELAEVIKSAMPPKALREKQHPAKRTFMAIRIAVNDELNAISAMLSQAADRLKYDGRLAVISFHSLEDSLVKNAIAARERGCTCPRDFPVCVCGFKQTLRSLTKKPITASAEEIARNPRARSAKLRAAVRV